MQHHKPKRAPDPLSMQIYSALLGDRPRIDRIQQEPATMRGRIEARLQHAGLTPFRAPTLRQQIERCATYAAQALDDARERLALARPAERTLSRADTSAPTPIVLIGPAAARRRASSTRSRAA